jgi:arginine:ornithine antiporter/lysine permease
VGRATIFGFAGVTTLMVLVSMLPFAVLPRADVAGMRQPSMAAVLESVVGPWGGIFVSIGLIVSVLGAYLAWSLICAEVMFAAARNQDMPAVFARENANNVPANALWITNIVVQLLVASTYFSRDAFSLMLNLTSSMSLIPYLFVAAYGFMVSNRGESYEVRPEERKRDLALATVAVIYTLFMIVAGGLKFILLSAILYAPGTVLYFLARRERKLKVFQRTSDWVIFIVAAVAAIVGVVALATGSMAV